MFVSALHAELVSLKCVCVHVCEAPAWSPISKKKKKKDKEWLNEWCVFIAPYCVLLYSQSALQSCGGSLLNHHQCAAHTWTQKHVFWSPDLTWDLIVATAHVHIDKLHVLHRNDHTPNFPSYFRKWGPIRAVFFKFWNCIIIKHIFMLFWNHHLYLNDLQIISCKK